MTLRKQRRLIKTAVLLLLCSLCQNSIKRRIPAQIPVARVTATYVKSFEKFRHSGWFSTPRYGRKIFSGKNYFPFLSKHLQTILEIESKWYISFVKFRYARGQGLFSMSTWTKGRQCHEIPRQVGRWSKQDKNWSTQFLNDPFPHLYNPRN